MSRTKQIAPALALAVALVAPPALAQQEQPAQPERPAPLFPPPQLPPAEQPVAPAEAAPPVAEVDEPLPSFAPPPEAAPGEGGDLAGYDFSDVLERMETSVNPLQQAMRQNFATFLQAVGDAEQLLDAGEDEAAVAKCVAAINGVLSVRDGVVDPMWEGQAFLNEQISDVRSRLARAVESAGNSVPGEDGQTPEVDEASSQTLDRLAAEIADEGDAVRKKRLVMRYQSFRDLARVRALRDRLTPNQRKLWGNVLRVLDEVSLAHQQMIVSTEVLFAQLEVTGDNLNDYLRLMQTMDGASRVLGLLGSGQGAAGDMAGFAENMVTLQKRLGSFNTSVEGVLGTRMLELEAELDAMPAGERAIGGGSYGEVDDELESRMNRVGVGG